jgi:hypothetical protein
MRHDLNHVLDATLRNTRCFAQHLKDSKVLRHVEAVSPKAAEARLEDLVESAPPVVGRVLALSYQQISTKLHRQYGTL